MLYKTTYRGAFKHGLNMVIWEEVLGSLTKPWSASLNLQKAQCLLTSAVRKMSLWGLLLDNFPSVHPSFFFFLLLLFLTGPAPAAPPAGRWLWWTGWWVTIRLWWGWTSGPEPGAFSPAGRETDGSFKSEAQTGEHLKGVVEEKKKKKNQPIRSFESCSQTGFSFTFKFNQISFWCEIEFLPILQILNTWHVWLLDSWSDKTKQTFFCPLTKCKNNH